MQPFSFKIRHEQALPSLMPCFNHLLILSILSMRQDQRYGMPHLGSLLSMQKLGLVWTGKWILLGHVIRVASVMDAAGDGIEMYSEAVKRSDAGRT